MESWISDNWFNLISTVGIIGSLLYTSASSRMEAKARRNSNLMALNQGYREYWSKIFEFPELGRVLKPDADVGAISLQESVYVQMAILHLASAFQDLKDDLMVQQDGLALDIRTYFNLPIPKAVWEESKQYQNADFVSFVERTLDAD